MAVSGLKSSGVKGRSLSSGPAPECPVQGALVTTVELLRLSVQVRCRSGLNLLAHSVQVFFLKMDFADILSSSTSVYRSPAHDKRDLSV